MNINQPKTDLFSVINFDNISDEFLDELINQDFDVSPGGQMMQLDLSPEKRIKYRAQLRKIINLAREILTDLAEGGWRQSRIDALNNWLQRITVMIAPTEYLGCPESENEEDPIFSFSPFRVVRRPLSQSSGGYIPQWGVRIINDLFRLLQEVVTVRRCAADDCEKLFVDGSPAKTGQFCSETCKFRLQRRRQRGRKKNLV